MFLHPANSRSSFHIRPKMALICTTGLGEGEYRSEGVVSYKYTMSQSHPSETAVPTTVTHDEISSTNEESASSFPDVAECHNVNTQHHKSAARGR